MSLIDWALLLGVVVLAGWRIIAPAGKWLLPALAALAVLAVIQLLAEQFYWQFTPAYPLIVALLASTTKRKRKPPTWSIWFGRTALVAAMGLAVVPFAVLVPVPVLPTPSGPFRVGTEIYRWVDASRDETATSNPSDKRNVIAQAWYPAQGPRVPRSVYMDGLADLPPQVILFPGFMMRSYRRIDTHAGLHAEILGQRPWPVMIFSPGFGAPRAFYSALAAELASRGYVVLALDHPYEAAVTQLADGAVAARIDTSPRDVDARDAWMADQLNIRATDFRFALDRLVEGVGRLKGHVDLSRVTAMGHSFGGATAIVATGRDPRIAAVVNIDGTPYGELPVIHRPFFMLQSDFAVTGHGESFIARNKLLLETASGPTWRYEVLRANHVVFMDTPQYFTPLARWVLSKVFGRDLGDIFGGSRGPVEMVPATGDILDGFVRETLLNQQAAVTRAVSRHREINGGRVK